MLKYQMLKQDFAPLSDDEATRCDAMLEEAAVIIDAYNKEAAAADAKSLSPAGGAPTA